MYNRIYGALKSSFEVFLAPHSLAPHSLGVGIYSAFTKVIMRRALTFKKFG